MPHAFLARECAALGITLPAPGHYGAGLVFLPRDAAAGRAECRAILERIVGEEGQTLLGWRACPPTTRRSGRARARPSPRSSRSSSARAAGVPDAQAFERKLYVIRKRVEHAVREHRTSRERQLLLPAEPLGQHPHLQGHALGRPDRDHVPGHHGPAGRVGAGPRPPALLHQHLPVLAAGAPVPLHRPQRRDQHAARQHQLDARARGPLPVARCSATTSRRSCRSSSRAAATRPSSTTCSSSWSWRAAPCPWPC